MKLRAPADCASICHDGQIFIVEDDGSIEVSDAIAATLAAHGFTPWEKGASMPEPQEVEASDAVDIDSLNRAELFSYLKAHGVHGTRNATNAKLRALARAVAEE